MMGKIFKLFSASILKQLIKWGCFIFIIYYNYLYRHPDTVNGTMSFNLEITLNTAPSVNNTISNVVFNGNRSTSYSFGSNLFYDSDGDSLTYSYIINPTASFLTVNLVSMSMSGFAANSNAGVYNITIIADDNDPETPSAYSSFNCSVI